MKFRQLLSCFALLLFCTQFSVAQITIQGKVTDETNGEELIGASIVVQGTGDGTVTDFDGSYILKIKDTPPVNIVFSYVGYADKVIPVEADNRELNVTLGEGENVMETVVVEASRISDKQKAAPLTVESLDVVAIKETTSDNFYDGLGNLKGVDLTAASLGFKVINTRGFNSTSPVRSLQIIDGVDNQAPGLNFSLGNFLGAPELDVRKVDIIQGASSSFYGPNAFNGVISMETKNPFYTEGLSAQVKVGERNMLNPELRWADSFKNKDGLKSIAYKFSLSYLRADDWVADNLAAVDGTPTPAGNPGGWDAVNRYGDEYNRINDFSDANNTAILYGPEAGLGILHREGYNEVDLVDYDTRNFKALGSVYIRTSPEKEDLSPELILGMSYGAGTTVYQGDNRFSLRDITFLQPRVEFRKRDDFFIRAFTSRSNAGNSYDPYFTALRLQDRAQSVASYGGKIKQYWVNNRIIDRMVENGYPALPTEFIFDPDTGTFIAVGFDENEARQWIDDNTELLTMWHEEARDAVTAGDGTESNPGRLEPGTPEFEAAFNEITSKFNNEEGGTRFFDNSALYNIHGEKRFDTDFAEIITGASYRLYTPDTRGTIFSDTAGIKIRNSEFGIYTGINKVVQDGKWRFNATLRADKNQNFNMVFTPAASVVWKPRPNHYLRVSFSSGVRNPTLSDQYLSLDVGPAVLVGNLGGRDSIVTLESFRDFLSGFLNKDLLNYINVAPIQPEKVKTAEVGYRATLFNNLYVDAGYYYSVYDDFIGYNIALDIEFDGPQDFIPDVNEVFRIASNATETVTTQGFSIGTSYYFGDYYQFNGNYSFNSLISDVNDPIVPAFNTPKHKYNLGVSGRNIPMGNGGFGFNVNYKWIDGFIFEGSPQFTGLVPAYGLLNGQINYTLPKINTTFKLGATNILDNQAFQTYGGPRIGRLAYASVLYEWQNKK